MSTRQIIAVYYRAWLESDRAEARGLLADDLKFRSPSDNSDCAAAFFDCLWKYTGGFNEMPMLHEVHGTYCGCIAYRTLDMANGEFICVRDGLIS